MKNIPVPTLSSDMSYSDIIVPTMDFVRGAYLIEKLLRNKKKVRPVENRMPLNLENYETLTFRIKETLRSKNKRI